MRKMITSIRAAEGSDVFNHDHKAAIIWASFKNRLRITENPVMQYQLG
jgi:hypothetical protein